MYELQQINNITFRDCAFVNNSGNGGSALEITPSYTEEQGNLSSLVKFY